MGGGGIHHLGSHPAAPAETASSTSVASSDITSGNRLLHSPRLSVTLNATSYLHHLLRFSSLRMAHHVLYLKSFGTLYFNTKTNSLCASILNKEAGIKPPTLQFDIRLMMFDLMIVTAHFASLLTRRFFVVAFKDPPARGFSARSTSTKAFKKCDDRCEER